MGFWGISREILDLQTSLFKLIMKSQAFKAMVETKDENLVTKLWHWLATNNLLIHRFFEFVRLAKLIIT
jgi:hypothetical protein